MQRHARGLRHLAFDQLAVRTFQVKRSGLLRHGTQVPFQPFRVQADFRVLHFNAEPFRNVGGNPEHHGHFAVELLFCVKAVFRRHNGKAQRGVVQRRVLVPVVVAKLKRRAARPAFPVAVNLAVAVTENALLAQAFSAPGIPGAERKRNVTGRKVLPVAHVAPVRHDDTARAVVNGAERGVPDVLHHVVRPARKRAPAPGARAEAELPPRFHNGAAVVFKASVAFVNPVEHRNVFRKVGNALRVGKNHVAPHHHLFSFGAQVAVHLAHIVRVKLFAPSAARFVFAHAKLKRLVEVRVHITGSKVRQQFVEQPRDKLFRARVPDVHGARCAAVEVLEQKAVFALRQRAELRLRKPAFHVAEGILVWHQVHIMPRGIRRQAADFLRRNRRFVRKQVAVPLPFKAVAVHIQFHVVQLHGGKIIDKRIKRFHFGNFVAPNVNQHTPHLQRRFILHRQAGDGGRRLRENLPQGLQRVVSAGRRPALRLNSARGNAQTVALGRTARIQPQAQLRPAGNAAPVRREREQPGRVNAARAEIRPDGFVQTHPELGRLRKKAVAVLQNLRGGKNLNFRQKGTLLSFFPQILP